MQGRRRSGAMPLARKEGPVLECFSVRRQGSVSLPAYNLHIRLPLGQACRNVTEPDESRLARRTQAAAEL